MLSEPVGIYLSVITGKSRLFQKPQRLKLWLTFLMQKRRMTFWN